jgi:hypothetical protein
MFPPPLKVGYPTDQPTGLGSVVLIQTLVIEHDGTNPAIAELRMPHRYQVLDFIFDVRIAFNSATSATGTAGLSAGGSEFASGVDCKVAGRARPIFTAAQLNAHIQQGTLPVFITITPSGATTAGRVRLTMYYAHLG